MRDRAHSLAVSPADLVLTVHFAIAAFIVLGLPAVWLGAAAGWQWVRNPTFRYAHLAAILFVAAEALIGMVCPLTLLEDMLRGAPLAAPSSFVERWLARLMYFSFPSWVFTVAYVGFAILVLLTLKVIPPRRAMAGSRARLNR